MSTRFGLAVYDLPATEVVQLARVADECGFDTLWVGEHVVVPSAVASTHPTATGEAANPLARPVLAAGTVLPDPWALLGAVAAATRRIRLATGVLVLPLHHPLLVARAVATLQDLSDGRFLLGVGSGWVAEEFAALDVPFRSRGRLLDASLELVRAALTGTPVGSPPVVACAAPVTVPVVVGGSSRPALVRAGLRGDGWLSSGAAGVDEVLRGRDVIETVRAAHRRDHVPFRTFGRLPAAERHLVDRYRAEGVDDVVVWADHVWPRDPSMPQERKAQHLRARAAELGVLPARAA